MLDMIREGVKRIVRFFTGGKVAEAGEVGIAGTVPEAQDTVGVSIEPTSHSQETVVEDSHQPVTLTEGNPVDLSRWTVTEHVESPFEKVGRLYVEGEDLVIRSDLDHRGFRVLLVDVDSVLDGEVKPIRLLGSDEEVGTVKLSVSGKGMNFIISPFYYTTPLSSVVRMLAGEVRKVPLFVGREQVE